MSQTIDEFVSWLADLYLLSTMLLVLVSLCFVFFKQPARRIAMPRGDGFASALALWEHPSQLQWRIAVLLDPDSRVESGCPRSWHLGAWGGAILSALLLSFATLHSARGRAEAPAAESPQPAVAADQVVFLGRVIDPEGKPYAGARIYFGYYWETHANEPAALRATSGPDGRFRFGVDRAVFNHIQNQDSEPWNEARLLAVAPGFGLGLSDSKEPDASHDVTLKLVRDDVPITGRLVNLEGRPVVGAVVRVESINASPSGSLNPWIEEARGGMAVSYQLEQKHLPIDVKFGEAQPPVPRVRSLHEGRFRIEGVGRERLVGLLIEGDSVRKTRVNVLTRAGDVLRVRDDSDRPNPSFVTYQPAQFAMSVAPGRVIEGTVRGHDTGEFIVRAHMTAIHRGPGNDTVVVRTRTNDAGYFRLASLPIEAGTEIYAFPDDQPYFGKLIRIRETTGRPLLTVDFQLDRGIWAEGKVTDKITGRPVPGAVRYAALADNPNINEVSGYLELARVDGWYATSRPIKKDGSYRVPVLPGRGAVILSDTWPMYPGLSRSEYQTFRSTPYLPAYGPVQAYKTVTVGENSQPIHLDFALDPGKTLSGNVLDRDGHPITGVEAYGTLPEGSWTTLTKTAKFTVRGLRPGPGRSLAKLMESRSREGIATFVQAESPRTLVFLHPASHLAAAIAVRSSDPEPLHVRLQSDATVTGRLVNAHGQPQTDAGFQVYYLGYDLLGDYIILPQFVRKTDQAGRFRIEGLAPGLRLRLWLGSASVWSQVVPPLKPGETRDLGDVKF